MWRLCLDAIGGHHGLQTHRLGDQYNLHHQIGCGAL